MKRFLVGAGWFVIFWLGALALGGAVLGAVAAVGNTDPTQAARIGTEAGVRFGTQYGPLVLLTSLAFAAIGTLFGWLPGTRRAQ